MDRNVLNLALLVLVGCWAVMFAEPALAAAGGGIVSSKVRELGGEVLIDGFTIVRFIFAAVLLVISAGLAAKKYSWAWIAGFLGGALTLAAGPDVLDRIMPASMSFKL